MLCVYRVQGGGGAYAEGDGSYAEAVQGFFIESHTREPSSY